MSLTLFHTTPVPGAILRDGFRDGSGHYGFAAADPEGVFLAKAPAGISDGADGNHVLAVSFEADVDLTPYAVVEDGHPVWEWCVPAALVNDRASVRLLSQHEVDAIGWSDAGA